LLEKSEQKYTILNIFGLDFFQLSQISFEEKFGHQ